MKTLIRTLFASLVVGLALTAIPPQTVQADDYWTDYWGWYDGTYRPYYYRQYYSPPAYSQYYYGPRTTYYRDSFGPSYGPYYAPNYGRYGGQVRVGPLRYGWR
jgi:hypothetical protein